MMTVVEQPSAPAVDPAVYVRPRLRPGVVFGPAQRRGDAVIHHVKDPVTGWFYRVGPREHFLMSRMDGTRGIQDLEAEYAEAFDRRLGPAHWQQLFAMLHRRQLLDGATDGAALAALKESSEAAGRSARRGPLLARFPLVDPDHMLDRIVPRLGFLYSPWFVLPALFAVVAVQAMVVLRWRDLVEHIGGGPRAWFAMGLSVLLAWLVITVHELAHGLTCKHFGGSVPEIGVLWRFPILAAYCKTDDVVLLPVRHRIYVAFAGVFASLVVLVPFAGLWLLAPAGTVPHSIAASVLLFGSGSALLNFVPFLRMDGYHILTHALNLVDLRLESYRFWGRLLRGGPAAVRGYPRRDRISYAVYGVATLAFVLGLGTLLVRLWYHSLSVWIGPVAAVAILATEGLLLVALLWYGRRWARRRAAA
jgi:putative peptide zinc metalloprotease protein